MDDRSPFVFTPRASASATAHDLTYPFEARSERITPASWDTTGSGTRLMHTLGSAKAVAEVRVLTWTGAHISGTDSGDIDTECSGRRQSSGPLQKRSGSWELLT